MVAATVIPKRRIWIGPQKHHIATDKALPESAVAIHCKAAGRTTMRCGIVSSIVTWAFLWLD
jgi:hypothetical protein